VPVSSNVLGILRGFTMFPKLSLLSLVRFDWSAVFLAGIVGPICCQQFWCKSFLHQKLSCTRNVRELASKVSDTSFWYKTLERLSPALLSEPELSMDWVDP